jgi:hypothetical protein
MRVTRRETGSQEASAGSWAQRQAECRRGSGAGNHWPGDAHPFRDTPGTSLDACLRAASTPLRQLSTQPERTAPAVSDTQPGRRANRPDQATGRPQEVCLMPDLRRALALQVRDRSTVMKRYKARQRAAVRTPAACLKDNFFQEITRRLRMWIRTHYRCCSGRPS